MGANLPSEAGDARDSLHTALRILHSEPNISITAVSRFWRTPAVPTGSGPDFVNAAALFGTTLGPEDMLARLHAIEARFGRDRSTGRWSARVLDLDLIAHDDRIMPDEATLRQWIGLQPQAQSREAPDRLVLPHPRLQDRGFVLAPLAEIAPGWRHPLTGLSVARMLADLPPAALAGMTPLDA
ncbi:2-amino-4-hydroxy-6-hydroxymethyldihydropteridine diphosphokinase [Paracoccus siganidrum]|uniref:2-amino-4-hydroxy-6-hydroxymethyldihydropteridine pyrophosphokinase n=1 Tax=Paracoccus siganidrum TaxID=1276757 RepID=A0A419A1A7_9RHOB|nr:2-amino-4-hydroxy-6-hydroxymethyldihydropteridine diphosphokinase [Paracoccus siganidrum]RJL06803.1 2-amino-4-hydroxy-6-hydroxymethyldihydropteridine diphosphokinase [Paracoccus siganidrum]RMC41070.1 2-amino-4-hydroxy-6-hydroxymethyldihydropteridine diphosphokinase [Paracoccus siganidrum]